MDFIKGQRKLKMQVLIPPNGKAADGRKTARPKGATKASNSKDYPLSTNVSSPVQSSSQRRAMRNVGNIVNVSDMHQNGYAKDDFVVSDNEDDEFDATDDEDAFEPIREASKPCRSRQRPLGPPITADRTLDDLNETHLAIVEEFMMIAKDEGQKVRSSPKSRWKGIAN
jgi:bloom syndrome protein